MRHPQNTSHNLTYHKKLYVHLNRISFKRTYCHILKIQNRFNSMNYADIRLIKKGNLIKTITTFLQKNIQ